MKVFMLNLKAVHHSYRGLGCRRVLHVTEELDVADLPAWLPGIVQHHRDCVAVDRRMIRNLLLGLCVFATCPVHWGCLGIHWIDSSMVRHILHLEPAPFGRSGMAIAHLQATVGRSASTWGRDLKAQTLKARKLRHPSELDFADWTHWIKGSSVAGCCASFDSADKDCCSVPARAIMFVSLCRSVDHSMEKTVTSNQSSSFSHDVVCQVRLDDIRVPFILTYCYMGLGEGLHQRLRLLELTYREALCAFCLVSKGKRNYLRRHNHCLHHLFCWTS